MWACVLIRCFGFHSLLRIALWCSWMFVVDHHLLLNGTKFLSVKTANANVSFEKSQKWNYICELQWRAVTRVLPAFNPLSEPRE